MKIRCKQHLLASIISATIWKVKFLTLKSTNFWCAVENFLHFHNILLYQKQFRTCNQSIFQRISGTSQPSSSTIAPFSKIPERRRKRFVATEPSDTQWLPQSFVFVYFNKKSRSRSSASHRTLKNFLSQWILKKFCSSANWNHFTFTGNRILAVIGSLPHSNARTERRETGIPGSEPWWSSTYIGSTELRLCV